MLTDVCKVANQQVQGGLEKHLSLRETRPEVVSNEDWFANLKTQKLFFFGESFIVSHMRAGLVLEKIVQEQFCSNYD